MKRLLALGAAITACAATTAVPTAAQAAPAPVIRGSSELTAQVLFDCSSSRTGLLQHLYSVRVLRIAQRDIPGDVANYTGCPDAIKYAVERSTATVTASIQRKRRGARVAGRIALLDPRGRTVDTLTVKRGQAATFTVIPGRYVARADGRRKCSVTVTAKAWRAVEGRIICRR